MHFAAFLFHSFLHISIIPILFSIIIHEKVSRCFPRILVPIVKIMYFCSYWADEPYADSVHPFSRQTFLLLNQQKPHFFIYEFGTFIL